MEFYSFLVQAYRLCYPDFLVHLVLGIIRLFCNLDVLKALNGVDYYSARLVLDLELQVLTDNLIDL
jgi:hypothetical protein